MSTTDKYTTSDSRILKTEKSPILVLYNTLKEDHFHSGYLLLGVKQK